MTTITPLGVETLVNVSTFGDQGQARGTALANGQYVVVWVDYLAPGQLTPANTANADIKARLFNADGTPAGAEFTVNTVTAGGQIFPNAITLSDGNFLVTWNNGAGTVVGGTGAPIATARGQEFTATGVPVGNEFSIGNPGVETLFIATSAQTGGGFVATWQQGGSGGAVVAQRYDSNNTAIGSQIIVDDTNLRPASASSIRTLANGNFVIAWNNNFGPGPLTNLQIYSADGVPVGAPIQAGVGAANGGGLASLVTLANGGFALGMIEVTAPTAFLRIYAYGADGSFVGSTEVQQQPIGPTGQNPLGLTLTPLAHGAVAASWIDNNMTDGSGTAIQLRTFGLGATQNGPLLVANTNPGGNQIAPAMLTLSNGDFVTLWTDPSGTLGDSSGTSIKQQVFDFGATNAAPTAPALSTIYVSAPFGTNPLRLDPGILTGLATDADGDPLNVDQIENVTNGTAFIDADSILNVSQAAGATSAVSFDYTVTDGNGGFATGRVRIINPTDEVLVRGSAARIVDVLANDFLLSRPNGYGFSGLQTINGRPQIQVGALNYDPSYYDLLAGQTRNYVTNYTVLDPVTGVPDYVAQVSIVLQGWAQIGGTGTDYLAGTALADSLQGGTGAANELIGGAGDDTFTVRAAGDTVIELAGGGTDMVRTDLASYVLSDNVEILFNIGTPANFVGVGNASDNSISATVTGSAVLAGLGGNDTLSLFFSGSTGELIGGTGNDTYVFTGTSVSVVEFANEGIDTVRTGNSAFTLSANLENLTYTGTGQFQGLGNASDNIMTGGTAGSTLVGLGGNDTYVVRNIGDTIVEASGGGTDTVQTTLSVYALNAANVENLTYTGTGRFTGIGNALNNVITGGASGDFLFAGAGTDTLTGGAGADIFFFDQAVNGIDAITDFTSGSDRLFFNQSVFTHTPSFALAQGAAPVATSANSTFLYDSATGALSYDADGTGAGAAIAVATLATGLTLTAADFVFYG